MKRRIFLTVVAVGVAGVPLVEAGRGLYAAEQVGHPQLLLVGTHFSDPQLRRIARRLGGSRPVRTRQVEALDSLSRYFFLKKVLSDPKRAPRWVVVQDADVGSPAIAWTDPDPTVDAGYLLVRRLLSSTDEPAFGIDAVTREGTLPPLTVSPPVRDAGTSCAFLLPVQGADPVTDAATDAVGLPAASPLRLLQDDHPLQPHFSRANLQKGCIGAYSHQHNGLYVAPDDAGSHRWTVFLDHEAPTLLPDGTEVWWVYPGTALIWHFRQPGPPKVTAEAMVFPADSLGPGPDLVVAGVDMPLLPRVGNTWTATVDVPGPATPWTIRVEAPANGPWIVVTQLVLGTGDQKVRLIGNPTIEVPLWEEGTQVLSPGVPRSWAKGATELSALYLGADAIQVRGTVPEGATGTVHVEVTAEGTLLAQRDLPFASLDHSWNLPNRLPPGHPITVTLSTAADAPPLTLTDLRLLETAP